MPDALRAVTTWTDADLAALDALEARVVAADGGRLKLEKPSLRRPDPRRPGDLLVERDGVLVGFLGLYAFGWPTVELAGAVDPAVRRQGVGTALLDEGLRRCRAHGAERALLVTTPAGSAFAQARGGEPDHREHALLLTRPVEAAAVPVHVRPAGPADLPAVARLLDEPFGVPEDPRRLPSTLVAERDGAVVASLRVERTGARADVYGFAVAAALRGRGLGRAVLATTCARLQRDGVQEVGLEVEVDNARALGLYTSLGFALTATEEYWRLPLPD